MADMTKWRGATTLPGISVTTAGKKFEMEMTLDAANDESVGEGRPKKCDG